MKKLLIIVFLATNLITAQYLNQEEKVHNLMTNLYGLGISQFNINLIQKALDTRGTMYDTFSDDISNTIPGAQHFYDIQDTDNIIINKNSTGQITVKIVAGKIIKAHLLYAKNNGFHILDLTTDVHFEAPEGWLEWFGKGLDDLANGIDFREW